VSETFDYAAVALTVAGSIMAALGAFAAIRISKMYQAAQENLQILREREFHSKYETMRERLETQVAELNRELTDTQKEFEEVNHLLWETQRHQTTVERNIEENSKTNFLRELGVQDEPVDSSLIFVLTPFNNRELQTYSAIVEAFNPFNVKVMRGDEESKTNILSHIVQLMVRARLVIANISTRNPNVMYELGIAHMLGKPVIMVSNTRDEELPFDLKNQTILFFRSRDELIRKLRDAIAKRFFEER
jgi:septal ring factor EnvC (AmiA/AmiB activator)